MDLTPSRAAIDFRERVQRFLATHLPHEWSGLGALDPGARHDFAGHWRETLRAERLLAVSWPEEYGGGGLGLHEDAIIHEEFAAAGVPVLPMPTDDAGFLLIGPTILSRGTEDQRGYFLPRIVSGEHRWCQGYSEPDAGSDLFSLRTRAERDGDDWVITGQKVWQTAGDEANWMFTLVRTSTDASRGRGLSLLLVPMDQPGVEVRTIRTMTGQAEFSEVFLSDARTPVANTVGPVNDGARVALALLGFERGASAGRHAKFRVELERLAALVVDRGLSKDSHVRQRLGRCVARAEAMRLLGLRALSTAIEGGPPGPESSVIKLFESEYHAELTELALEILGADGLTGAGTSASASLGPDPLGGSNDPASWQHVYMTARAATIYGGSSQIQRSTIGERILGLPRGPRGSTA